MRRSFLFLFLCVGLAGTASADILHLRNGRTMEGKVVSTHKGMIHLKVPGGSLMIPERTVKRIEKRISPREEYATRAQRTDMSDPAALDSLAHWASSRGLGDQAIQLRDHAKGLRLQAKVDTIRKSERAAPFVTLYHWAVEQRYSREVQGYLLEEALEREPNNATALAALIAHERNVAPRKLPPKPVSTASVRERQRRQEERDEIARELEARRVESEQLRARLKAIEGERRVVVTTVFPRRRRRRHRAHHPHTRSLIVETYPDTPEERAALEAARARFAARCGKPKKEPIHAGILRRR